MSSEVEHAADEAGGEIVYSSDGLSAIPKPTPKAGTTSRSSTENNKVGADMILDSAHLEASDAFEVFAGKIYPNQKKATAARPSVGSSPTTRGSNETALQRLARLQQEVAEVEEDLKATDGSTASSSNETVLNLIKNLKGRLEDSTNRLHPSQQELTRLIQKHIEKSSSAASGGGADETTTAATTTTTTTTTSAASDSSTGVVYELYGGNKIHTATTGGGGDEDNLENNTHQRLLQLEKVLGTLSLVNSSSSGSLVSSGTSRSSSSSNKSILHRLEEMENLFDTINEKSLEQAAAKAKVIRSDLEAASKARNKLLLASASTSGTSSAGGETSSSTAAKLQTNDSKTIAALYDQMNQLEGLSGHLPALVHRLQQLASLHTQSATFATRLSQTEKEVVGLNTMVTQLEQVFTKLEQSTKTNLETMETNLRHLDESIENLK